MWRNLKLGNFNPCSDELYKQLWSLVTQNGKIKSTKLSYINYINKTFLGSFYKRSSAGAVPTTAALLSDECLRLNHRKTGRSTKRNETVCSMLKIGCYWHASLPNIRMMVFCIWWSECGLVNTFTIKYIKVKHTYVCKHRLYVSLKLLLTKSYNYKTQLISRNRTVS